MHIWRIEHSHSGRGLHTHWNITNDLSRHVAHASRNNPEPLEDDGEMGQFFRAHPVGGWNFGFSSIEQMIQWFSEGVGYYDLKQNEFVIRVYETSEKTICSSRQVAFVKDMARLIETLDPVTVLLEYNKNRRENK